MAELVSLAYKTEKGGNGLGVEKNPLPAPLKLLNYHVTCWLFNVYKNSVKTLSFIVLQALWVQ